jgi:putative nucleotidyltransferase with HDIG domain
MQAGKISEITIAIGVFDLMNGINGLEIIARTLSQMDIRLIDHGKNVAFLIYNAMKASGRYSEKEILDMCLVAVFHDIGAFKTEEVTRLAAFDAENALEHSVYGYLFIRNFSPVYELASAVLFHHISFKYMTSLPEYYRDLAQILHIADRIEILSRFGGENADAYTKCRTACENGIFDPKLLPFFAAHEKKTDKDTFWRMLCETKRNDVDNSAYLKMLVLSIDFRSRHTVNHTIATTELSRLIAESFDLPKRVIEQIIMGALLHDVGKAGIPVEILEKPGRLDDREMTIMKSHILLTGEILRDCVYERIARIAFRHHEKLDGSGYPAGLNAAQLSFPERIVAVADILSALSGARSYKSVFPKEHVISILTDMSALGQLDPHIVRKIVENYDFLISEMNRLTKPVTEQYDVLSSDYARILEHARAMLDAGEFGFELIT